MPILVFHPSIFIYIPLAWKQPDKAITVVFSFCSCCTLSANAFHYSACENIAETWRSKCCPFKASSYLRASGCKPLGQVICTVSIPEELESTRLTQDEPSLSIHMAAWAHHLYLHSSSIKLLCSVNYVYYPSYRPIRFYSLLSLQ